MDLSVPCTSPSSPVTPFIRQPDAQEPRWLVSVGAAAVSVGSATALTWAMGPWIDATPFALLNLAVLATAAWVGTTAGWWAVAMTVVAAATVVVRSPGGGPPGAEEAVALTASAAVSAIIVVLVDRIRRQFRREHRRRLEAERLGRLQDALARAHLVLAETGDRTELLNTICRILVERGGFRMAAVAWPDVESHRLVVTAEWGDASARLAPIAALSDDRLDGDGPAARALREDRTTILNDVRDALVGAPTSSGSGGVGYHALAAFPIRRGRTPCGVLKVFASEPGFFQLAEVRLLEEAASGLSRALLAIEQGVRVRDAEARAHHERELVDVIFESAPAVIYLFDEQGRFLRWNRNFSLVTGYTDAEIATMHPLDFFREDEVPLLTMRIAEGFRDGTASVEAQFIAKDGHATPYFFTGRRIEFEGRTCLVGMGIDITERRRAEAALRRSHADLEQRVASRTAELQVALKRAESADRLKSAFLATMSHELRTPLNSILGFTGLLLQQLPGPLTSEQQKQLTMVRTSARHLLDLIKDVLDISRIEAGQLDVRREPAALAESVERVLALIRPAAEAKGLDLVLEAPDGMPEIVSDRRRLEQVLLNLLGNAVKFTDRGRISLRVVSGPECRAPDGRPAVELAVRDSGIGIAPEEMALIFEPFRQVDSGLTRRYEGTGLGLAISRRLVELLGGNLTVSSSPGIGSTFRVTIPIGHGQ